jgi:hypothetical protein
VVVRAGAGAIGLKGAKGVAVGRRFTLLANDLRLRDCCCCCCCCCCCDAGVVVDTTRRGVPF